MSEFRCDDCGHLCSVEETSKYNLCEACFDVCAQTQAEIDSLRARAEAAAARLAQENERADKAEHDLELAAEDIRWAQRIRAVSPAVVRAEEAEARADSLERALRALAESVTSAVEVINHPAVSGTFMMAAIHGAVYSGPVFDSDKARAALALAREAGVTP